MSPIFQTPPELLISYHAKNNKNVERRCQNYVPWRKNQEAVTGSHIDTTDTRMSDDYKWTYQNYYSFSSKTKPMLITNMFVY